MNRTLFFLAAFLAFTAMPAQSAEIRYTGGSSRDPFAAPLEQRVPGEDFGGAERKLRSLNVQGVVASAANPRAIISGQIYRVGSELMPGVKITRIVKDGVFVSYGDKEILLGRPTTQPTKGKNTHEIPKNAPAI